jgi:hypothetical protein
MSFIHLLRLTANFRNEDPKDVVFALLGVETKDNLPAKQATIIKADYQVSQDEIHESLVEEFIRQESEHPLSFLIDAGCENLSFSQRDWAGKEVEPTWVPQWTKRGMAMLRPWSVETSFHPANGLHFKRQATGDSKGKGRSLKVQGIEVTTVLCCFSIAMLSRGGRNSGVYFIPPMLIILFDAPGTSGGCSPEVSFLETFRALASTLCGGRNAYGHRAEDTNTLARDFAAYLTEKLQDDSEDPPHRRWMERLRAEASLGGGNASRFHDTVVDISQGRCVFVTTEGHIGLGGLAVKPGDSVCVLGGADMPFTL